MTTTPKSTESPIKAQGRRSEEPQGNEDEGSAHTMYIILAVAGIVILAGLGGAAIAYVGRSRLRRVLRRTQSVNDGINEGFNYDRFR